MSEENREGVQSEKTPVKGKKRKRPLPNKDRARHRDPRYLVNQPGCQTR